MEAGLETNHGLISGYCAQRLAGIGRAFYSLNRIPGNLVSLSFFSASPPPTTTIPDTPPPSSSSALELESHPETNHGMIFAYCSQKMAAIQRSFYSLNRIPGTWVSFLFLSTSPPPTTAIPDTPPPSSSSALDLEAGELERQVQQIDPQSAGQVVAAASAVPGHANLPPHQFDWTAMITGFCLTSAVEIALQSLQPQIKLPLLVHLLSLSMLFAFASVFVSKFISPNFPTFGYALILVSKVSVLAAFFFAITVPFTLSLKLMSWSIFGVCLLSMLYAAVANGRVTVDMS